MAMSDLWSMNYWIVIVMTVRAEFFALPYLSLNDDGAPSFGARSLDWSLCSPRLPVMWHWTSLSASVSFGFLTDKMATMVIICNTLGLLRGSKLNNTYKARAQSWHIVSSQWMVIIMILLIMILFSPNLRNKHSSSVLKDLLKYSQFTMFC